MHQVDTPILVRSKVQVDALEDLTRSGWHTSTLTQKEPCHDVDADADDAK